MTYDVYGHLFRDPAKDVDLLGEMERELLAAWRPSHLKEDIPLKAQFWSKSSSVGTSASQPFAAVWTSRRRLRKLPFVVNSAHMIKGIAQVAF
jgi:hypothetical protein